ncbi:serine hydrolase domain-containing protein [Pseudidiomarina sp.]|uniref:serine hydrolase domain-containing protein n=1 Tax=Pseudidiomarina sp. TaxID=2081707 RepID=UPI003A977476
MLKARLFVFLILAALVPTSFAETTLPSEAKAELNGEWRGALELPQGMRLTIGIAIDDQRAELVSPNQGPQTYPLQALNFADQQLSFAVPELGVKFSGAYQQDHIVGEFEQGAKLPLTLHRLSAADQARLKFEGKYAGVLKAGGMELPLHFNIAVVKDGFVGTLDSPAQESYGIPLGEVSIDSQQLKAAAPMLKATYQGKATADGDYQGVWFQGMPYELNVSKVTAERPAPEIKTAEFGTYGGATAHLKGEQVMLEYAADHNDQTLYEIGSVTKTFVAYLLADAVQRGVVELSTELQSIFPDAPEGITLLELATHTSGLPRLPEDLFAGANQQDPYRHYDLVMLTAALRGQTVGNKQHSYSNYAFGVLGEALAKVQDTSLEKLMQERIFKPFGMESSYLATANRDVAAQLAIPHNSLGQQVEPWRFAALAGAGAVVASLPDMVNYVQGMQVKLTEDTTLRDLMLTPRVDFAACCEQALGWMLEQTAEGKTLVWHNGRTAGFASYVGFYADSSEAVILLSNQAMDVNSQAKHVLSD